MAAAASARAADHLNEESDSHNRIISPAESRSFGFRKARAFERGKFASLPLVYTPLKSHSNLTVTLNQP